MQPPSRGCAVPVYIALGSNLGASRELLAQAVRELERLSAVPVRASSFYETSPVDCPPGAPRFLNAVALLQVAGTLTPESLLHRLKTLEKAFGRQPKRVMNEPRALDLDIIDYGQIQLSTPELTLPHPRAHERAFVLAPLAEIAPELVLPGQTESVAALLQQLPGDPSVWGRRS